MAASKSTIAVIGAGNVGASVAFAALLRGIASHVSIFDLDGPKVAAEVLDLAHGLEFVPAATVDGGDDIEVCRDADVLVVTAGAKQKPGQSRLDLAATNAAMCRTLIPRLVTVAPDAVVLLVTNPVDVLTAVAVEVAGLPAGRVFGSGTVLDSSRLRHLIARQCHVAVQNVHAHIVGEHGDSEVALWTTATIAGIPLADWRDENSAGITPAIWSDILHNVRHAAKHIIAGKGATNWAIGLATARILEAIVRDERRVLPVSGPVDHYDGLDLTGMEDVCFSLPRIVGSSGVGPPLSTPLSSAEATGLEASARAIHAVLRAVRAEHSST